MPFDYRSFSLEGRISRQNFWLGLVLLTALTFALIILMMQIYGITPAEMFQKPRPQKVWHLYFLSTLLIPAFPLLVKRLHDRGKSAWYLLPVFLVNMTFNALQYFDLAGTPRHPTPVFACIIGLSLALNINMIVQTGFLRGTKGSNRYGPDPLSKQGSP